MQFADKYKNNDNVGNEEDDNNDDNDDDDNDNDDNNIHIIINDILILMIMTITIMILMTTKIKQLLILIIMIIITFRLPILVVSTRIHGTGIDEKHFFCYFVCISNYKLKIVSATTNQNCITNCKFDGNFALLSPRF